MVRPLYQYLMRAPLTTGQVAYCSSKHAVIGLTKAAALDCAPHRIYVNAVCPGCMYVPSLDGVS